jgi:hypothetical protein
VLPFGRLWYAEPNAVANAIGYALHRSRSHHAVIRVYDAADSVIESTSTRTILTIRDLDQAINATCDLVNVAPRQLGEEIARDHFGLSSQSF